MVIHSLSTDSTAPADDDLLLASGSVARALMLRNAGLRVAIEIPAIDEPMIRRGLEAEGASGRDVADALAELKAAKISRRRPGATVLGADQVLVLGGEVFAKPDTPQAAAAQLRLLSGRQHSLFSAAVVCIGGLPQWRHVGEARITFHDLSDAEIKSYVARTWDAIRHAVGCYLVEEEGIRLIAGIEGDTFTIRGLPLVELLTWLRIRGDITA